MKIAKVALRRKNPSYKGQLREFVNEAWKIFQKKHVRDLLTLCQDGAQQYLKIWVVS